MAMSNEQGPEEEPQEGEGSAALRWVQRRRSRRIVRRVGGHMEPRVSFGLLTLSTMGFAAGVILLIVGIAGGVVYLADNEKMHALAFFLAGFGLASVAVAFGLAMGFVGLPIAGDWFLEWPSHAIGWGIGISGCGLLAALLFLTPVPAYAAVPLALIAVFGAGYVLAYGLRVTRPLAATRKRRPRAPSRRT